MAILSDVLVPNKYMNHTREKLQTLLYISFLHYYSLTYSVSLAGLSPSSSSSVCCIRRQYREGPDGHVLQQASVQEAFFR